MTQLRYNNYYRADDTIKFYCASCDRMVDTHQVAVGRGHEIARNIENRHAAGHVTERARQTAVDADPFAGL